MSDLCGKEGGVMCNLSEKAQDTSESDLIPLLTWEKFDEGTVPKEMLLLCECRRDADSLEYHSGAFHDTGNGGLMGIVGGHFHFDRKIERYASIERLLPSAS